MLIWDNLRLFTNINLDKDGFMLICFFSNEDFQC